MASNKALLHSLADLKQRLQGRQSIRAGAGNVNVQVMENSKGGVQVGGNLLTRQAAKPCKHCGTYVLGTPANCPHCAMGFDDGRPRLGSAARPHDCREPRAPASQHVEEAREIARVTISTQAAQGSARNGGSSLRAGGKIGLGLRAPAESLALPDEHAPSKTGPVRKLLGYLIRLWLRAWLKRLDGR